MHLQLAADAPVILRAGAGLLLGTHIAGASLGMLAGAISIFAKKGGQLHRRAGTAFFVGMLGMSSVGAVVAPMLGDRVSGSMGLFTLYLVLTGWLAAKRTPATSGRAEIALAVLGTAAVAWFGWIAWLGSQSPKGIVDGLPSQIAWGAGTVAALALASDLKAIRRGGLVGADRLVRHLWRMGAALFIAWGSFAGQPMAQPEPVRNAPWLFLPALGFLGLMAFWWLKTRQPWRRRRAGPALA
jgi:hypothetical protein